jgi:hypothetical protein
MDEIHVHHLTSADNKRVRINPRQPSKSTRRHRQTRPSNNPGEISFSTVRPTKAHRAARLNNRQVNINPPPLPSSTPDFLLHSPPGTPHRARALANSPKTPNTPSLNFQFLDEADAGLPTQSVSQSLSP